MKRTSLLIASGLLFTIYAHAQQQVPTQGQAPKRNCGTMEYLELQKQKNPELEKLIKENELHTQEWIRKHAGAQQIASPQPAIPGYKPTGDQEMDHQNYAIAKQEYLESTGFIKPHHPYDEKLDAALREAKRKSNAFVIIQK